MAWLEIDCTWRGLVGGRPLDRATPPLELPVPEAAFDYGAITDPLPFPLGSVLKVTARAIAGRAGLVLSRPNGSALASAEQALTPADGTLHILFHPDPDQGPVSLLLRNYDNQGHPGSVLVESVAACPLEQLGLAERERVLASVAAVDAELADRSDLDRLAPAPPRTTPLLPMSLGNSCEAKVQIARTQQFRLNPRGSQPAFRLMMTPPDRGRTVFGWDLFDWQGTPFNALCAYLERDFQGVFERQDLEPDGVRILHRFLKTEHAHQFEDTVGHARLPTQADIDQGYAAARKRFEALADAFRRRLERPGDFLYVLCCEDIPTERAARRLLRLLSARCADHRFRVLFVGFEDEASDLSAVAPWVDVAWRPRPQPGQSEARGWEGDYAAWDKALAAFTLRLPDGRVAQP